MRVDLSHSLNEYMTMRLFREKKYKKERDKMGWDGLSIMFDNYEILWSGGCKGGDDCYSESFPSQQLPFLPIDSFAFEFSLIF
jgi:hypothetical protein